MVYYKLVKVTINALCLVKVIINVVVRYHRLQDSIIIDQRLLLILKFWLLLCYFLGIKQKLFINFHPQIDDQIKKQNNTMEEYL